MKDQVTTLVYGLKADLLEIREYILALQARPVTASDLIRVWKVYSDSMLFITVKQMIMPTRERLIATFEKVIILRRSLERDWKIALDPNRAYTLSKRTPIQ